MRNEREAGEASPGRRAVRAGFRDPRFVVGLVLVVGSVLGVVGLVRSLDSSQPVYAAARDLGTGETVTSAELRVVEVRLGDAASAYLGAASPPPEGTTIVAPVHGGELIPLRALGPADDDRRPLALQLDGLVPAGVGVGGRVDVYATARAVGSSQAPPRLVVSGLEVARVGTGEGSFAGGETVVLEVLVPPEEVAAVVEARSADRLDVVAGARTPGAAG